MSSRCHICVDPECEGREDCRCDSCSRADCCHRVLRPTIRITLKCTQSCSHCCFECKPSLDKHMTIEMARKVKSFLVNNDINYHINLMGGEFFCNPDWYEIFSILSKDVLTVRIVTNGDWADNPEKVLEFMSNHPQCYMCISKDKWHTNEWVAKAHDLCEAHGIIHKLATDEETTPESIVPVGRSRFEYNFYSTFANYCSKPDRKYTFLIDEEGEIYKCGFGAWAYANVKEYINGGFSKRFKSFNRLYYKQWVPSCKHCLSAWTRSI